MLPPAQERLFVALADHQPHTLEQLFPCVKMNDNRRIMYRRIRLLARDTENALRADESQWCIANSTDRRCPSGFVMRLRSTTDPVDLADNVKPCQKWLDRTKETMRKPKRKARAKVDARRKEWTKRKPRIFLDPTKGVR